MSIDKLFEVAATRQPNHDEIAACCAEHGGGDTDQALNAIALELARRYDAGAMSFGDCDVVANALHSWSILIKSRELPRPALDVFSAFDQGEYYHNEDSRDVDPEAKYTRPAIKEILRARNAV